jgi:hypothetical protein
MHQPMGKVGIRHLEPIIHSPKRGAIGIADSSKASTRRRVRLEHNKGLSCSLGEICRIYIRLDKVYSRSMSKIAGENVLRVLNGLAGVECRRTIVVGVAIDN